MIKNNKEKVFELKIQEDDEVSGIDSISLVDEPAIEINWVAFKKEKEHEFHIPDGEDELYLDKLMSLSHDEQDLFDEGWVVSKITILGEDEFYSTDPNAPSEEDEKEYNVRYKYVLNPRIKGQSAVIPTTRDFCKTLINQNRVWRIEDMDAVSNDFGDSALVWRGGFNCRHVWARMEYRKDATIINKASVNKGKINPLAPIDPRVLGLDEPNTVTDKTLANPSPSTVKNLGLSKEQMEVGVPHYTADGKLYEGPTHKDADGRLMTGAVHTEDSEYLYHIDELESVSDYPESVKNNAKAVLKYVEENGWGDCGTEVGKIRANQLANGEPISEDTVKRMYSYLSRHKVDLESSKGYGDGCGKLMYDSWGGLSALSWAESKIKTFSNKEFAGEKVSMDYDDTLDTPKGKLLAKRLINEGKDFYIVTRRQESALGPVLLLADELGVNRDKVHATNGKLKWETIKRLGIGTHYDNNPDELKAIEKNIPTVHGIQFDYDIASLPAYVDELPKKKPTPKAINANSEFVDEKVKCEKCGWEWDLENGGNSPYMCNKCGNDNSSQKQNMSIQHFATDTEKHIVLGPAMIPEQKIFRKDALGNPYYVFFTSETIKMIAEKYMKNKYTDNNDTMHDGKPIKDIHVVESWIKESKNDKSSDFGYGSLPIGTWFVSMKVNNPEVWKQIKEGKLNGFSVSGYFEEVAAFSKEEMFLYKVAEVIKNIKD